MRPHFINLMILYLLAYNYCKAQDIDLKLATPTDANWGLVSCMMQDAQGFLWLAGNEGGLYKYDGYKTINYRHDPLNANSLADDWVESMYVDTGGFVLAGTYRRGLDRFDIATGNITHYTFNANDPLSLSNDTVLAITKDRQGMFWIGTNNGLNRFDPRTAKFTRYKNDPSDNSSLSDNQVRALFIDHAGILWVGTESPWPHDGGARVGGLNRFNVATGKFTRYMHDPNNLQSISDNRVSAIFEDSRGTFWIGTANNGLNIMNRNKGTFDRYTYDPKNLQKLSGPPVTNSASAATDYVTFIKEDAKGDIWIGSLSPGLIKYEPAGQKITRYLPAEKYDNESFNVAFFNAYLARDNTFWIASWNSFIYKTTSQKNPLTLYNLGMSVNFFEGESGILWMSNPRGLIKKNPDGSVQKFPFEKHFTPPLQTFSYYNTIEDDDHNLWTATTNGLYRFNPATETFNHYRHVPGNTNSLISDSIIFIGKGEKNILWIGAYNGLDKLDMASGRFTHFVHNANDSNSISHNTFNDAPLFVSCITIGKNNVVWLCVANVVSRLDVHTGHFKKYPVGAFPQCVKATADGNVWAGANNGLYRYDSVSDKFLLWYDPSGIIKTNTPVSQITEDRQKNLWLRIDSSVVKLNLQKNEAGVYYNHSNLNALPIYSMHDGKILVANDSGYISFYPDSMLNSIPPPGVAITDFAISDEPVNPATSTLLTAPVYKTKKITLSYNQNTFSFAFTSIDFTGAPKHLLYKLENYDTKWRNADREQTAGYYNVPTGKYIFKVKALGGNGAWSEKDIAIIVSPPWWRTWWSYCIYAVLFIAAVYTVHRIQKQKVIQAERERTRERELAQSKEIEKAYHQLKTTQAQLIQSEKMASLGELTAGIAHEIQNPLNFVNNFSEVNKELISELKEEMKKGNIDEANTIADNLEDNEEKIIHHGKRADAIVKGMLQHSRVNTGQKEPTYINALADEYLRLSYHGLRAKEKSFKATLKTDFDESIGKINVVPQDIGRVLLNLYNNAFYAIMEKKKQAGENYEPTVSISTKKINGKVEIRVKDNGNGIPQKVLDKIFQPFFTTKPTGQGTGLGLSLSYDIIKAHGGEIKVDTKEGEGAELIIQLHI